MQSIEGGEPVAFTPDGMDVCRVSPSGGILAVTEDSRALLYSSHSSKQPDKELKFENGDVPIAWSADGNFLYLVQALHVPRTITRFEVASGHRLLWKQIPPPPAKATIKNEHVVITPDGQSFAYTYSSHSSDLYLVLGLK
jgi:hypothetical protein